MWLGGLAVEVIDRIKSLKLRETPKDNITKHKQQCLCGEGSD